MAQTPDIRVRLSPEGVNEVVAAFRKVEREALQTGKVSAGAFNAMSASIATITRVIPGLSFAVAIASISAFVKQTVSAAANLDDLAEKTGASVEELSKLEQQARISGTEIGTVETALVRLAKGLNGTDEESKKTTRALAALGLEASRLRNLDTAEALRIVAARLNEFRDGAGKTALAMDLFGRSGAQVLPFLKDLANDQALAARVTAEQAAKSEELEKGIRRLANEFRVAAQELTLQLVPGLLRYVQIVNAANRLNIDFGTKLRLANPFITNAEAIARTRKELEEAIRAKEEFFSRTGVNTQAQLDAIAKLQNRLQFFKEIQAIDAQALGGSDTPGERQRFGLGGAKPVLDYASATDAAGKKVSEAAARFEDYEMRVRAAVAQAITNNDVTKARELVRQIEVLDALFFESGLDAEIYEAALRKLTGAQDNLAEQARIAAEELRKQQALASEGQAVYESTRTPVEQLAATFSRLQQLLDAGVISWDTYARATFQAQDNFDKLNAKSEQTFDTMTEFAMQAARNIQDHLANALASIGEGSGRDMAFNFIQALRKMAAEALAFQINTALFGNFAKTGQLGGLAAQAAKFFGFGAKDGGLVTHAGMFRAGAELAKLAGGGMVRGPGGPTGDRIPAMLSDGEFVVRAAVVRQPGMLEALQSINRGLRIMPIERHFLADGGLVGEAPSGRLDGSVSVGIDLADGLVARQLQSSDGQRLLVRLIGKNKRALRGALGI